MSSGSNREISLEGQLVKIIPVQTDRHHRDLFGAERLMKRRWRPVIGRYFTKNLTVEKLKEILIEANVDPDNFLVMKHENFIAYRYKDKPLIALNIYRRAVLHNLTSNRSVWIRLRTTTSLHHYRNTQKTRSISRCKRKSKIH